MDWTVAGAKAADHWQRLRLAHVAHDDIEGKCMGDWSERLGCVAVCGQDWYGREQLKKQWQGQTTAGGVARHAFWSHTLIW